VTRPHVGAVPIGPTARRELVAVPDRRGLPVAVGDPRARRCGCHPRDVLGPLRSSRVHAQACVDDKGSDKGSAASNLDPAERKGTSLVPHTGFEPVISALRGRCPRPLDECGAERRAERHDGGQGYQRSRAGSPGSSLRGDGPRGRSGRPRRPADSCSRPGSGRSASAPRTARIRRRASRRGARRRRATRPDRDHPR
jgi:hypothetical protein